jgi:hypothetical protein
MSLTWALAPLCGSGELPDKTVAMTARSFGFPGNRLRVSRAWEAVGDGASFYARLPRRPGAVRGMGGTRGSLPRGRGELWSLPVCLLGKILR